MLRTTPLESNKTKEIEVAGKEEVQAQKAHALPFPRDCLNLSPTDLSARKKHDAVPPQLRSIGTETVADVIINDAEACALLDSRATADLMTLAYAEARNFDIRAMTELSDCFINLRLAARFKTTLSGYFKYNLQFWGSPYTTQTEWPWWLKTINTPFSWEVPLNIETKTKDTILEAVKEGEINMLDSIGHC